MKRYFGLAVSFISFVSINALALPAAVNNPSRVPQNLETCFSPHESCDQKIVAFIGTAQKTIDMAIYTLSLYAIRDALIAARQRGVNVRIVCDHSEAQGKTSQISQLQQLGFAIKFGNEKGLMHNKFTIVDGRWLETGSYNYSYGATNYNAENQIYMNDPQVLANFQQDFDSLWSQGLPVDAASLPPVTPAQP